MTECRCLKTSPLLDGRVLTYQSAAGACISRSSTANICAQPPRQYSIGAASCPCSARYCWHHCAALLTAHHHVYRRCHFPDWRACLVVFAGDAWGGDEVDDCRANCVKWCRSFTGAAFQPFYAEDARQMAVYPTSPTPTARRRRPAVSPEYCGSASPADVMSIDCRSRHPAMSQ